LPFVNHGPMSTVAKRRIGVIIPGRRPQVIQDAVTLLVADRTPLHELHVLTPAETAVAFRAALSRTKQARWFTRARPARGIVGDRRMVHTVGRGETLGSAADDLLRSFRDVCDDPLNDVRLVIASDAGPLGLVATQVFQWAAKPGDRVFLLTRSTKRRAGRSRSSAEVVELPFVLPEQPLAPDTTYQQLAASRRIERRRQLEPRTLTLDRARRIAIADDTEISLPRVQFFWLYCFATLAPTAFPLPELIGRITVNETRVVVAHAQAADLEVLISHVRDAFLELFPHAEREFPAFLVRACGQTPGLPSVVAKVNRAIRQALGTAAEPYLIAGGRRTGGYRLTLPPSQVRFST
jgi:hypothetical protein